VIDSFFQDSICSEEEMGYNEDGAGIDIVGGQKDRANRSVTTTTNVRVSVLALGVGGPILTMYMGRRSRQPSQLL
jgi:hypothetical protein